MADTIGLMGVLYVSWKGHTFVGQRSIQKLLIGSYKVSSPDDPPCRGASRCWQSCSLFSHLRMLYLS